MERKELRHIPARDEEQQVGLICDSCGKESPQSGGWANSSYDVDRIAINRETGASFPEGGSGERFVVDLCPECFEGKLLPWLDSQGIKGRIDEWDW